MLFNGKINTIIHKIKHNKSGSMTIEMIIALFILVILVCAVTDVAVLGYRFFALNMSNSFLARTTALQGGVMSFPPTGFGGGSAAYQDRTEISNILTRNFSNAGITSWQGKINDINFRNSDVFVDYGYPIVTELSIVHSWTLLSNFIPGTINQTLISRRVAVSEFKRNYNNDRGY